MQSEQKFTNKKRTSMMSFFYSTDYDSLRNDFPVHSQYSVGMCWIIANDSYGPVLFSKTLARIKSDFQFGTLAWFYCLTFYFMMNGGCVIRFHLSDNQCRIALIGNLKRMFNLRTRRDFAEIIHHFFFTIQ